MNDTLGQHEDDEPQPEIVTDPNQVHKIVDIAYQFTQMGPHLTKMHGDVAQWQEGGHPITSVTFGTRDTCAELMELFPGTETEWFEKLQKAIRILDRLKYESNR